MGITLITDKEAVEFIKNARLKMEMRENTSEAEQLVIALLDNGRRLSNEEIATFIYFMDIKYEEFKAKQNYNEEIEG